MAMCEAKSSSENRHFQPLANRRALRIDILLATGVHRLGEGRCVVDIIFSLGQPCWSRDDTSVTAATASYRYGHEEPTCHYKNPHTRNKAWRRDNRHLIDHFKAQHERNINNSSANPNDNRDI
ncbi:hypothetical protein EMCG_03936 [[Emmonsia] crescens]|uniref:Uncharacterized protein n=1 Tax=[Emmonsia] crescens TaxID=73230 RepID=A0A0G2HTR1_9EURO|nr:hypothetical protein EMCG_03936 [Emmonsia crescens UAMH 3008]